MFRIIPKYFNANPILCRFYKNAGIVFTGKACSSVFTILSIVILTRALSLEQFGFYTLLIAYINLIERFVSFQTWQAMIYYGSTAKKLSDSISLISLFVGGAILDTFAGVLGFCLAILGVIYVPSWFGLQTETCWLTLIAACKLIFNWTGISTGFLRLYDRFVHIAISQNINSLIQLCSVMLLWLGGVEAVELYIFASIFSSILGQLLLLYFAVNEANKQQLINFKNIKLQVLSKNCQGIWQFVFSTNADGIVRTLRDLDIFIINFILGPSFVALYKIARVITRSITQFTGPFYQAIYPEISHLFAKKDINSALKLMKQASISLLVGISFFWVTFILIGKEILSMVFGINYIDAYFVSIYCMAAMVVWGGGQSLAPGLLAAGKPNITLKIHFFTTIIYLVLLFSFTVLYGVEGAGIALLVFYFIWVISMYFSFKSQLQKMDC
jgi:O-antigen/teichoic acid export membrane protein